MSGLAGRFGELSGGEGEQLGAIYRRRGQSCADAPLPDFNGGAGAKQRFWSSMAAAPAMLKREQRGHSAGNDA